MEHFSVCLCGQSVYSAMWEKVGEIANKFKYKKIKYEILVALFLVWYIIKRRKDMKFFDDKSKINNSWYNRNYFFTGTLLFVLINIILFAIGVRHSLVQSNSTWSQFDLTNLFISFTNIFKHYSWDHILHNSLMIFIGGFYVERKIGTFKFLSLLFVFSFVGGSMTSACANSFAWGGSSVVWFALYGYILIDYLFSFVKTKRNKINVALGAIILVIEYIRAGFYDKVGGGIGWGIAPYQLIYNTGHYVGFIVGVIFALTVCFAQVGSAKKE